MMRATVRKNISILDRWVDGSLTFLSFFFFSFRVETVKLLLQARETGFDGLAQLLLIARPTATCSRLSRCRENRDCFHVRISLGIKVGEGPFASLWYILFVKKRYFSLQQLVESIALVWTLNAVPERVCCCSTHSIISIFDNNHNLWVQSYGYYQVSWRSIVSMALQLQRY